MGAVWSRDEWSLVERAAAKAVLEARTEEAELTAATPFARRVLRSYSTSFFIVTRFLPPAKRGQVELVYAAVRFPDEVVDTFPVSNAEKTHELDRWAADYGCALRCSSLAEALDGGLDCFVSAFAQVVRRNGIPADHYRSFLDAMRLDVEPRRYRDLGDLIESYVYGSAIVVGYFLAYVYGPSAPGELQRALRASRDLGIALQLTNFLRDVREDRRRGRVYLPADLLEAEGIEDIEPENARQVERLNRVLRHVSATAEQHYLAAERDLDAFAADCRIAIQACINVYRRLNERIGSSSEGILHRESVPMREKFEALPASKYWRLPLAYLGAI